MFLKIPETIDKTLKKLENNGFEAYIVGGCVRDLLLKKNPSDYDITTNALPNEVKLIFDKTVDTGIKHGTVTVIENNIPIEITTYRTENGYSDTRRPDSVSFVSNLNEDLSRRDFTVNAMCYNPKSGLIDLFGGTDDLNNKRLKAVGNAEKRFSEDALRIMRLFRFSSVLDFKIENETFNAALKCKDLLKNISVERISLELIKAICGKNPENFAPLINSNALEFLEIFPTHNLNLLKDIKENNLKIFYFLIFSQNNFNLIKKLRLSNDIKNYCENLDKMLGMNIPENKKDVKKMLSVFDNKIFSDYLDFTQNCLKYDVSNIRIMFDEIIKNNEPYKIEQLLINGDDLIKAGYKGKDIGEKLKFALSDVINNPSHNKKDILMNKIQSN